MLPGEAVCAEKETRVELPSGNRPSETFLDCVPKVMVSMAVTPLPPFEDGLLARFLVEASGASNVELSAPALLSGGAIRENWRFDAEFVGGPFAGRQHLVLRTDGATGIPSSLGGPRSLGCWSPEASTSPNTSDPTAFAR